MYIWVPACKMWLYSSYHGVMFKTIWKPPTWQTHPVGNYKGTSTESLLPLLPMNHLGTQQPEGPYKAEVRSCPSSVHKASRDSHPTRSRSHETTYISICLLCYCLLKKSKIKFDQIWGQSNQKYGLCDGALGRDFTETGSILQSSWKQEWIFTFRDYT